MSAINRLPCQQCNYPWAMGEWAGDQAYYFCPSCGYEEHVGTDGSRYVSKGYGAYRIAFREAPDRVGCFHEPVSSETITRYQQCLSGPDVDTLRSYLTRWDEIREKVVIIIGKSQYLIK